MRYFVLLAVLFLVAVSARAESVTSAPAIATVRQPVALAVVGVLDSNVVERARRWAEDNLAIPVPMIAGPDAAGLSSFNDVSTKAASLLSSDRLGMVVLWMPDSDIANHGAYFPAERVAVVNMKAMMDAPDEETAARRVERQVIRGICLVMGLEPNPNPQSAMYGYSSREELDLIGRNLDPPWLLKLQEKALESGIPVNYDNPFSMVFPPMPSEPENLPQE